MTNLRPIDPQKRIEILDVLRGFALLGIIFNNILYFSGYSFLPFDDLREFPNYQLNEKIYSALDIIITAKFYTLFSILFAVGFHLQFKKNREDSVGFLKVYRRRLFFLLLIGLVHSLIWFGDILLMYAMIGFILILFRNAKKKHLFRWSLFFMLLPVLMDLMVLPFSQAPEIVSSELQEVHAHTSYPDMTAEAVVDTFQNGSIVELFVLNIHHLIWKWLSYIPSGRFLITLGIFLLGYYLSSIQFFKGKTKSRFLLLSSLTMGLLATILAQVLGGSSYQFPPTLPNIIYKVLLTTGQIFLCIFYVTTIYRIAQTATGNRLLGYLKPMGRMALTNYLMQTIVCIFIFYNFGFDLIGRVGLVLSLGIAVLVLVSQVIISNIWLRYFKFGPLEWLWRSMTYRTWIEIRYDNA